MFLFDLPLSELEVCLLPQTKAPDFDAFWERMLAKSRAQPLHSESEPVAYSVPGLRVERFSFAAFDGGRIVGWAVTPDEIRPRPTLLFFHGYTGNKRRIADYLMWALQGFTCFAFDVRGQSGDSTDAAWYDGGHRPGWITRGILDPEQYYFTRAYLDAVRAVDFAVARDETDPDRIGVTGCSQGGGLSLAVCSLDSRPKLCMSEVPAFCHFGRTLEITREAPWTELIDYFRIYPERLEPAMRTLSYIELNNLAERIQCPVLMNVALADMICVPSSIFSVYNRIPAQEKRLMRFPYNGHEGGLMTEEMILWARRCLMAA